VKDRRYLLDSTLRDGEQSSSVSFTRDQKLSIASMLDEAGVSQIEAGAPAIGEYERETIRRIVERRRNAKISVWARMTVQDIRTAAECGSDIVHISVPVSYVHIYVKLRKNKNWVINELYACLGEAQKRGVSLSVGYEDAFRSEAGFLVTVTRILLDYGVTRIRLADTVGLSTPSICRQSVEELTALFGGRAELGIHAHNDLGMALGNTLESLKAGCRWADVTLRGIGERAGNCDLLNLVRAGSRFDFGITAQQAARLNQRFIDLQTQG